MAQTHPEPISEEEMAKMMVTILGVGFSEALGAMAKGNEVTFIAPYTGQKFRFTVEEVK